jgi:hypothetical protein
MYDRPTLEELIDAVRLHLESQLIPVIKDDPKLYFQTLVAINVLKIAGREVQLGDTHLRAEWVRLNALENTDIGIPAEPPVAQAAVALRNEKLCQAIRAGEYDDSPRKDELFAHLIATTCEQLEVANPRYLQTIAQEAQAKI